MPPPKKKKRYRSVEPKDLRRRVNTLDQAHGFPESSEWMLNRYGDLMSYWAYSAGVKRKENRLTVIADTLVKLREEVSESRSGKRDPVYRGVPQFFAHLKNTVWNCSKRFLREEKPLTSLLADKTRLPFRSLDGAPPSDGTSSVSASHQFDPLNSVNSLIRSQEAREVRDVLERILDPDEFKVVELRAFYEFTHEEIAKIWLIDRTTITKRLQKIGRKLRRDPLFLKLFPFLSPMGSKVDPKASQVVNIPEESNDSTK